MIPLLLLGACSTDAAPAKAAVEAAPRTAAVEAATWTPEVELTGTLEPRASVQLGFDVPGRLDSIRAERGEQLAQGAVVATLDARMAEAQAGQADAAVAGATAQLAAGEAAFTRATSLHAAGAMSDQDYQSAEAQVLAGRAGVEQARAAARLAHTHLANHTLRAPIAGVLTMGPDNAGTMVGAGTPLFYLEDLSALQVKLSAPESASWLAAGQVATVWPAGATVGTTGAVTRVIPALDPATRRIPVEVSVAASAGLRAHAFVRVTIAGSTPIAAFRVPKEALVARPEFGVVVQGAGLTPVVVLGEDGDDMFLMGALVPGVQVLLDPPAAS
jgi:RND family efflux transporter MFP subunit